MQKSYCEISILKEQYQMSIHLDRIIYASTPNELLQVIRGKCKSTLMNQSGINIYS